MNPIKNVVLWSAIFAAAGAASGWVISGPEGAVIGAGLCAVIGSFLSTQA